MALPQPKRAPGTYVTLDKARLNGFLQKMSVTIAIPLYLEVKSNYEHDGATLGELVDVLGRSPKTIQNALAILKGGGAVRQEAGRYYPSDELPEVIKDTPARTPSRGVSRDPSRTLSRGSSRNPGNEQADNAVPDDENDPLKEEKEEKEEKELEGREERPLEHAPEKNAFETVAEIIGDRDAVWLRDRRGFDFARAVGTFGEKLLEVWQKALADPPRKPKDRATYRFQDACEGVLDLSPPTDSAGFSNFSGRGVKVVTSSPPGPEPTLEQLLSGPLEGAWGRR